MVETNNKQNMNEIKGTLTYEGKVIQKIVGLALESVDGGFFSSLTGKLANTDNVTAGVNVEVVEVNVAVIDITTKAQQEEDEVSLLIIRFIK